MEGQRFVLMEIDIYSGYRFVFPPLNASASTTIHGLTRMPYPPPYILNRIVSYIYIYIYLFGCAGSYLQHVGSSLPRAGSLVATCRI